MGHDITAYKPGVDREAAYARHKDRTDDELIDDAWCKSYDQYEGEVQAAYLRRAAWNPLARVIYIALECTDLDAGCSGTGESRMFNREQIASAYNWIHQERHGDGFSELTDVPANFTKILNVMGACGAAVATGGANTGDVTPELNFLNGCMSTMDNAGADEIEIQFG